MKKKPSKKIYFFFTFVRMNVQNFWYIFAFLLLVFKKT